MCDLSLMQVNRVLHLWLWLHWHSRLLIIENVTLKINFCFCFVFCHQVALPEERNTPALNRCTWWFPALRCALSGPADRRERRHDLHTALCERGRSMSSIKLYTINKNWTNTAAAVSASRLLMLSLTVKVKSVFLMSTVNVLLMANVHNDLHPAAHLRNLIITSGTHWHDFCTHLLPCPTQCDTLAI